jgi:mRNA interferase RelE/StbE
MTEEFDKSFYKSVRKLKSSELLENLRDVLKNVEEATSLKEIRGIKKLIGYKVYYRIRVGNYRIGIELIDSKIVYFIVVAHRKDIYNLFP